MPSRKTRVIRRKLDCLNSNPQRWDLTLTATAFITRCQPERVVSLSQPVTSAERAMASEAIEGDEWGAYVTLATFSTTGTRDGLPDASPMATESS